MNAIYPHDIQNIFKTRLKGPSAESFFHLLNFGVFEKTLHESSVMFAEYVLYVARKQFRTQV